MVVLNLLAALALLLWGTGQMERALRDLSAAWVGPLGRCAARGRHAACTAGLVAGLLEAQQDPVRRAARIAQPAAVPEAGTLAVSLGAWAGGALAILAFTLAPSWTFQVLLVAGAATWNATRSRRLRAAGRALFGAGALLLGLQIAAIASASAGEAGLVAALAQGLEQEALLGAVLGALAAFLLRSAFAAVLLLATAGGAWLAPAAALAVLAGIHLGGALASWVRLPEEFTEDAIGHLLAMLLASGSLLLLAGDLPGVIDTGGSGLAVVNAAFCALAAAVLVNFSGPLARLAAQLSPAPMALPRAAGLRSLQEVDPRESSLALAAALRQVMRLADLVGDMLHQAPAAVLDHDRAAIDAVRAAEAEMDDLYRATKHYLAKIPHWHLSAQQRQRWEELIAFLIALEQVADGIDRMLPRSAGADAGRSFLHSPAAQAGFRSLHGQLSSNLRTAVGLCLERRPAAAAGLLAAEEAFRKLERSACAAHIGRVVAGDAASLAAGDLHLDVLADLAHMNARLCGFARLFLDLQEAATPGHASGESGGGAPRPNRFLPASLALDSGKETP